ncbi:MAG TPA: hypothetical protein VLL52_18420 [Anaerolineae bacterium]|nr:hypothetical protein [Anaerolineae bacterium]
MPTPQQSTLAAELQQQITTIHTNLTTAQQHSQTYATARLIFFFLTLGLIILLGLNLQWAAIGATILLATTLFLILVRRHDQLKQTIIDYQIDSTFLHQQLARLHLNWDHLPPTSDHDLTNRTSLEIDFDILAPHGLHRLLNTTTSHNASQRLRQWLNTPYPDYDTSHQRQQIVQELLTIPHFRQQFFHNAARLAHQHHPDNDHPWPADQLLTWLQKTPDDSAPLRRALNILTPLALLNITLFLLNLIGLIPPLYTYTFVIYALIFLTQNRHARALFSAAVHLQQTLHQLQTIFHQLATFDYAQTPHLGHLCTPFHHPSQRPSQHLRPLNRVVTAAGLRSHGLIWLILNTILPWDIYFAYRLNQIRNQLTQLLPPLLDRWFDLETLHALANFAYLHPDYTFPTLHPQPEPPNNQPPLTAHTLGHPLLPTNQKISNDFTINHLGQISLITGSNMAGKSTFLKTLGLNLALAYAGAPVNATQFATIPWRLASCLKITDSVADGISYFYAEVRCLQHLLAELNTQHPYPVLFFIDELFQGTNNRERLLGSRALIQALAAKYGAGLVSTHDLELTQLEETVPGLRNLHFREEIIDQKMVFDYKLHPGPCPTTNALKIMALAGLPIPDTPPST